MFARLRLVPDHRDESVLVQEVALQWQHCIVLVTMLLQRLSKLSQQIAVDFPDMDCNVVDKEFPKIASKVPHRFESGVETSVLSWPVEGKVPIKSANIDTHGSESSNAT